MPELPEVETVARALREEMLLGRAIVSVNIFFGSNELQGMQGRRFLQVGRRGKFLVFTLSKGYLLAHLRMSGKFLIKGVCEKREKHEQVLLELDDGRSLRFFDPRKFGRLYLVADPEVILGKLGPEPLELEFEQFWEKLKGRARALKPLLLDQEFIAGIGNIYADEALWRAGLHPLRIASELLRKEAVELHRAIQAVLLRGIAQGGTSLGKGLANFQHVNGESGKHQNLLDVYGRTGEGCKRCRTEIEKIWVAQRGTHFCSSCQKLFN